jgi:hypothetical protein
MNDKVKTLLRYIIVAVCSAIVTLFSSCCTNM